MLKCSIVIPSFNTRDVTLSCIEKIRAFPADRYELIVVDNNSTDGSYEAIKAKYPNLLLLRNEKNLGFAKACNRGAREAKGFCVLFLNSDAEISEGNCSILIERLEQHSRTGIVGPLLTSGDGSIQQMSWGLQPIMLGEIFSKFMSPQSLVRSPLRKSLVMRLQAQSRKVPMVAGACLMIKKQLFDQLNGFDENYELYFEDADLCLRCTKEGYSVEFVKEAIAVHHLSKSVSKLKNLSLIFMQSHILFYRKHGSLVSLGLLKAYLLTKWLRLKMLRDNPIFIKQYKDLILGNGHSNLE